MIEFYCNLKLSLIKVEVLRQLQLVLLCGKIEIELGLLDLIWGDVLVLKNLVFCLQIENFVYFYYWVSFIIIGSLW